MMSSATKAKKKYNHKVYDNVWFNCRKGGGEAIAELARIVGRSKADYIRALIATDARRRGRKDLADKIGGGGVTPPYKANTEPPEAIRRFLDWLRPRCLAPKSEQEVRLQLMLETLTK